MRLFGLIGRSLGHSFSQTYFTQKFSHLQLSNCRYDLFELATVHELPQLLERHPELVGLNVTIPYKEQVLPYLADVASSAARVGAVNVIEVQPGGRLVGHNTDVEGFGQSLRRFYVERGGAEARALVLGTGGAAKAVGVSLRDLGIPHFLVSRDPLSRGLAYADLTPQLLAGHHLVVNATPLGTYPNVDECPPLPYAALTPQHYLFDLIYNPSETEFLRRGRAAGARIKNGFEMLALQAEAAWAIWNGL